MISLEKGKSFTFSSGLLDITKKYIEQNLGIMDDIRGIRQLIMYLG